ncbi:acetamidase/formamidase family protein [Phytoactinopolyspora mesophila]|uniref:Acetamidase n=1 Tax=Phytoactinopolyspora mesophila TaxID=2650750 RepID=A0A7K3M0G6_9ACTN|nr:acetamidase/formamidase family protein [Phytoactinopolyspora mesophila]NDL56764.1 acetamidase [Phytoactinopolyspora mesophila]
MAVHEIRIDRTKSLQEEPHTGHNRWHPDIPPILRCEPGDEVILETRDAFDGQFSPDDAGAAAVERADLSVVHPLTGPIYVEDAEPGDVLEVEILEVEPDSYGYTVEVPGFGFLRDEFPEPFKVNWDLADGWATSGDLPGVRIPGSPFMGTIGLTPGHDLLAATTAREQAVADRAGLALPPSAEGAVPTDPHVAQTALRTVPPREQAGNVDIKQLGAGTLLLIPVDTPGALFSAGDAHFAQGDCETCGTAIEMNATLRVRFGLRKGEASAKGIRDLRFARDDYYLPPEYAVPRRFFATTGISVTKDGQNRGEDATLAARNALLNMIDHLGDRGWTRQQAYAICSVAVDLKISQLVDVPNMLVSAFLPEDIFVS